VKPLQLAPIDDEQNEDFARVAVADFVEKRYGIPFDEVSKDYEGVTTQLGLTGNSASHYAAIKANNEALSANAGRVAKRYNKHPLIKDFLNLFGRGAGDVYLGGSEGVANLYAEKTKAEQSAYNAGADKLAGLGGMFETIGAKWKDLNDAFAGLDPMGGVADAAGSARDRVEENTFVRPDTEQSLPGQISRGFGQATGLPLYAVGVGSLLTVGQIYQEGRDDYEAVQLQKGLPVDEAEMHNAGILNAPSAALEVLADKLVIGKILKPLEGKVTVGQILKGGAVSFASGGLSEGAQTFWQNTVAKYLAGYDPERKLDSGVIDSVIVGGVVDSTMSTGLAGSAKLYDKYLNPETGATPLDFKTLTFIATDETVAMSVYQKTGSVEMAELAVRAKNGDPEAQAEYVKRSSIDPAEDVFESSDLTDEEQGAFPSDATSVPAEAERQSPLQNDTSSLPGEYYDNQEQYRTETPLEFKKAALQESIDFFSSRALEGSTIVQSDDVRLFEHDLIDMRDAGYTDKQIEAFAFSRIQAAGQNDGKDYSGLKPSQFKVFGKNLAEFKGKVFKDVSFIYKGGSPLTVIEEVNHGYFERTIAEGTHTLQDFIGWKHSIEEASGEKTHSDEHEGVKEWVAQQAQAWMAGKTLDADTASKIPPAFLRFLEQLLEYVDHIMARANLLRQMSRDGELDEGFETFLERSLGLDEDFLEDQYNKANQESPEISGESFTSAIAQMGGLPRPDEDTAFRGELEIYYESKGTNWKSLKKRQGVGMDKFVEGLKERGFQVDTISDVFDLADAAARGQETYAGADVDTANMRGISSFSMGGSTVTPDQNAKTFPTKDGGLVGPASFSMTAFHGTPHKVDKFSTEKIGTGEGAQAYGYGLYFAQNKAVADDYRDQLANRHGQRPYWKMDGVPVYDRRVPGKVFLENIALDDGNPATEIKRLNSQLAQYEENGDRYIKEGMFTQDDVSGVISDLKEAIEWIESNIRGDENFEYETELGSLYKVELNVEEHELLDWDKRVEDQAPAVRDALLKWRKEAGESFHTGEQAYSIFVINGGTKEDASEMLAELGIKGIKYLDGGSRSAGEGSSNYVIFNDADITITEENGEPVELPKPAASYSMAPYKERSGDEQGEPLTETEIIEGIEDESGTLIEPEIDDDAFSNSKLPKVSYSMALDAPTIKRSDLKGKKKFVYFSDRTRVGVYEGLNPDSGIKIDLQGGPRFPFIEGHNGAQAGWAFTTEGMFTRFAKRVDNTDGIGLVTLYSKENLRANPTFLKAYVEELKWAIKSKKLTNKDFVREVNELRVAARNAKKKGSFAIPRESEAGKLFSKKWNTVEDFGAALSAATFDVRGGQFFAYDSGKVSDNKGSKIATDKRLDMGFPDITKMVDMFVDPDFADAETGTIVSAVEFEKGQSKASSAKDIGSEEHLSYPVVIKGRGLGYFEDPIHVTDVLGIPAGKTERQVSRSAETSMAGASFSMAPITEKPQFKKWFGDSKVVDENGEPLVVYHGTAKGGYVEDINIESFDLEKAGDRWNQDEGAFFFTNRHSVADDYAMPSYPAKGVGAVYPVYLSIKNPLVIDSDNDVDLASEGTTGYWDARHVELMKRARARGHDGVVLKEHEFGAADLMFVAFEPTQIKSATGNNGNFDGNDPRISNSMAPLDENEQVPEPRPRTKEEGQLSQALRDISEAADNEKPALKRKIAALQIKATESRKRQRLEASAMKKIEVEVNKRTEAIRRMAKERTDLTAAYKALDGLINNPRIPSLVRGRIRGVSNLSQRTTEAGKARYLEMMADRVDSEFNKYLMYEKKKELRKFLSPYITTYGPNLRKLSGRVNQGPRDKLIYAAQLASNSEAPAPAGMSGAEVFVLQSTFEGVLNYGTSADRIGAALKAAGEIAKGGRTELDEFHAARKERNEARNSEMAETVLSGEKGLDSKDLQEIRDTRSDLGKVIDFAANVFFHPMNGFQQKMIMLDGVKGGNLEATLARQVFKAGEEAASMGRENAERTDIDILSVFNGNAKHAYSWGVDAEKVVQTKIEYSVGEGMKARKLSKMQAIDILLKWGDLSLSDTMQKMGIDNNTIKQIKEFVGPEGVKLASYLRARYANVGGQIQTAFKSSEGFSMDLVDNYGGRVNRIGFSSESDEPMFAFGGKDTRATAKNGSLKERMGSVLPIQFNDAMKEFNRHMRESIHYITHAQLAKDFGSTFNDADVKNAIEQRHGKSFKDELKALTDDIISGGMAIKSKQDRMLNSVRANITKADLAIKPAIMIKQLTSAPAFIEEVGVAAYAKAAAELQKNPSKWLKLAYGTDYVKNRLDGSIYADIQQQMDMRANGFGKAAISNYLMIFIKLGDIGAVLAGGTPIYIHAYQQAKAAGKSNSEAEQEAESVFGQASDRAQQASSIGSRGRYLRSDGLSRTWFMYMTSPIQYQRNINVAAYNFGKAIMDAKAGRKAEVGKAAQQFGRAFVMFHIVLPQIFQAVASGLTALTSDDDDILEQFWARQRKALYLGNLSTFPILGQMLTVGADVAAGVGEVFLGSSGSPLVDLVGGGMYDFYGLLTGDDKAGKALDLLEKLVKPIGAPLETINNYFETFAEIKDGDTEFPISRMMGWSKWALGED
jgi:hypothetical protein